jgi:hypothetical protein
LLPQIAKNTLLPSWESGAFAKRPLAGEESALGFTLVDRWFADTLEPEDERSDEECADEEKV